MFKTVESDFGKHRIWLAEELNQEQIEKLLDLLHRPVGRARSVLGGRRSVAVDDIDGLGPVAVKHFTRGGVLGNFIAHRYLRFGATRSQVEFELMNQVRSHGIKTPDPVAHIHQGLLFYRAWLVTREIENHRTLAELSLEDEDRSALLMKELVRQIDILIMNRIFHVDLHPGNVLINPQDEIYLVDFDKAHIFKGPLNLLRDKYLRRWRRAVIKHRLPEVLSEWMCAGLRRRFEAGARADV